MLLLTLGLLTIGVLQVICLLALVDQYKGILQIRNAMRLADTPYDLDLAKNDAERPSAAGLPGAFDVEELAVVVVFSTKCASCVTVAQDLRGRVPPPAWALIAAGSEDQCREFQRTVGLPGDRVLLDVGGQIASNLKVRTFPSAVVFSKGALVSASTIPSYRQLKHLLDETVAQHIGTNGHGGPTSGN